MRKPPRSDRPVMTSVRYVAMKRAAAATAGRPIRRLECATLGTLSKTLPPPVPSSPPIAALQWHWFEGDQLMALPERSVRQYQPSPFYATSTSFLSLMFAREVTAVVSQRADLDRILDEVLDAYTSEWIRVLAAAPLSRRLIVLTEALTLRYWAPSWCDTSKFADWAQAFGLADAEPPRQLEVLTEACCDASYPPEDSPKYRVSVPDRLKSPALNALNIRMDAAISKGERSLQCLILEQMLTLWSTIEQFDSINLEQSIRTGSAASLHSSTWTAIGVSGQVRASSNLVFNTDDDYWLMFAVDPHEIVTGKVSCIEPMGSDGSLRVNFYCPDARGANPCSGFLTAGYPSLVVRPDSRFHADDYVGQSASTTRWCGWQEASTSSAPTDVPLDVVVAGNIASSEMTAQ